ncbi:MAG: CHASE domain-containing protein [Chthoniobacter sp.]|uniref:CHASE domain-containing protein n=1 Tax=Chthoniobacter sp. TaxID=2510640 RepID=UPI0032A16689
MSPLSALCFSALGVALLALVAGGKRWRMPLAGTLSSIVISLGVIAIVGYIFGLPGTYGWGQMTRVAPHTAAGFVVLGTGLFLTAWHSSGQATERTPRWLPIALALATVTATLVLYFALDSKQNTQIARIVRAGAESARSQITLRMEARMKSLVRMASRWESDGRTAQASWEADATSYIHDFPDMQAIEWIDTAHAIRWIAPFAGNEAKVGLNLVNEERRAAAIAQAEREHQPAITRTVPLFHGGLGYVVYVPLTVAGQPDGVLGTVFRAEALFARYLPAGIAPGQAIRISEGGLTVYERDAGVSPSQPEWIAHERVEMHGTTWDLRTWPTPALLAELNDPLPEIVLAAGLLGGVLLAAVCYLAQRASRLARLAARARDAMQRALEEVKTLKGLLPICACCKRVRDDTGYWSQVDTYLHRHTDAKLSHGYCPECAAKAFTEFGLEVPERVRAELAERNFE